MAADSLMRIWGVRAQTPPSQARRGRCRDVAAPGPRSISRGMRSSCFLHQWRQWDPAQRTSPPLQKLYVVLTAGFIRVNTEASTQGGPHISHPICARLFELHGNDIG